LLCSKTEKLLATTLSRCQVVRFGAVDEERVVGKLTSLFVDPDEATYWARFSEGSIGTALNWATLKLKDDSCYQIKCRLVGSLADQTLGSSLELAEWFCKASATISKGLAAHHEKVSKKSLTRLAQKGLMKMAICAFSDAVKVHLGKEGVLTNFDQQKQIIKLAGRNDIEQSAGKIEKTYENLEWIDASVNEKLIFEELLLNYAV
jgi:DNA polymerase-3 subunit delta'